MKSTCRVFCLVAMIFCMNGSAMAQAKNKVVVVPLGGDEIKLAGCGDDCGQAVQIRLNGGSGGTTYTVPSGKQFVLETVVFPNYWTSQSEDRRLIFRHGGPSITGSVWDTTQTYFANWNRQNPPTRIPAGISISAPFLNDSLFQIFLYGRLLDLSVKL